MDYLLADVVGVPRIVWFLTLALAGLGVVITLTLLVGLLVGE